MPSGARLAALCVTRGGTQQDALPASCCQCASHVCARGPARRTWCFHSSVHSVDTSLGRSGRTQKSAAPLDKHLSTTSRLSRSEVTARRGEGVRRWAGGGNGGRVAGFCRVGPGSRPAARVAGACRRVWGPRARGGGLSCAGWSQLQRAPGRKVGDTRNYLARKARRSGSHPAPCDTPTPFPGAMQGGRAGSGRSPMGSTPASAGRSARRCKKRTALDAGGAWSLSTTSTPGEPVARTRSDRRSRASLPRAHARVCGGPGGAGSARAGVGGFAGEPGGPRTL